MPFNSKIETVSLSILPVLHVSCTGTKTSSADW